MGLGVGWCGVVWGGVGGCGVGGVQGHGVFRALETLRGSQ